MFDCEAKIPHAHRVVATTTRHLQRTPSIFIPDFVFVIPIPVYPRGGDYLN